jgi:hypothetical protein
LTRASIDLHQNISKRLDCRVKPGNDEPSRAAEGRRRAPFSKACFRQ